jgi:acetoin utilization deacetylase AcuC-like enzyme
MKNCYDFIMRKSAIIADKGCKKHLTGIGHPESPARFDAIVNALTSAGIKTQPARLASVEEILLCHTEDYLKLVQREVSQTLSLAELSTGDVVISPDSYQAALLAVGSVATAIDRVLSGEVENAFVVVRPPGHHACTDRGMGFCLFNNVAIGARYAKERGGLTKILIVDWDVHHGNGTQEIFDADPSIFYFSTHQAGIYPGTGAAEDRGVGPALGTKMNFPIWPTPLARKEILAAVEGPLTEAMEQFKPELVLISCGFDAHFADPLGQLNLTDDDFIQLTEQVLKIADRHAKGRLVSVLEGGYNLHAIATAAVAHVKTLMGR